MKLVSTYAAYSTKPSVKNSSQDDFEQQFCCYLSSDILLPECTSSMPDAFCFLTSSTKANKAAAAGILLQNAKEYAKNHDVIIRDSNTLRRIGLIATAVDVCKKEDANADCIVKIFDDMCTRLVQDSQLTARIVGNIALSTDIRKGFEIMTEGGDSGGFWHARRSMEISLIADFKILVLSEMILSDGKSKLFFKSLLGSKWIERVKVSKLDLSSIVELSRGLINDEHWCTTNCESYLIALIDLITIRAAESDWYYLRSVTYSAADIGTMTVSNIKDKVLELFCGEKTEMILFNLSEENFTKISKAVFKHVCHKMLKPKILENAARIAGELVSGLKKSFLDHIVLRTKRPRCRDVVRGLLEQILLHIFLSPVRSLWPAIHALQISIEKRDEELNSLFQVLILRPSLS